MSKNEGSRAADELLLLRQRLLEAKPGDEVCLPRGRIDLSNLVVEELAVPSHHFPSDCIQKKGRLPNCWGTYLAKGDNKACLQANEQADHHFKVRTAGDSLLDAYGSTATHRRRVALVVPPGVRLRGAGASDTVLTLTRPPRRTEERLRLTDRGDIVEEVVDIGPVLGGLGVWLRGGDPVRDDDDNHDAEDRPCTELSDLSLCVGPDWDGVYCEGGQARLIRVTVERCRRGTVMSGPHCNVHMKACTFEGCTAVGLCVVAGAKLSLSGSCTVRDNNKGVVVLPDSLVSANGAQITGNPINCAVGMPYKWRKTEENGEYGPIGETFDDPGHKIGVIDRC